MADGTMIAAYAGAPSSDIPSNDSLTSNGARYSWPWKVIRSWPHSRVSQWISIPSSGKRCL